MERSLTRNLFMLKTKDSGGGWRGSVARVESVAQNQ
jgi:hypothetical protein